MKVMLISTTIYPSPPKGYAGTEMVLYDLASELNKMGHEVSVASPIGSSFPEGINHIPTVEHGFNFMTEQQAWGKYVDELLHGGYDIIHDHSFMLHSYLARRDHPELKVCATLHGQVHFRTLPPVKKTNLICLSNSHAMQTSAVLGVPVKYVHNGTDITRYEYHEEKQDYFLSLGRIARFKGAHELIQLAEEMGFRLWVMGEDRFVQDPTYVHQVMNMCGRMAKYFGEVSNEAKVNALKNASALLFYALWDEPFGLTPIEANASGTPAIVTARGALPEIVKHGKTGYICNNREEFKRAIENVDKIKPEDCRRWVERNFTAKRMANDYVKLYEQILAGNEW